MLKSAKSAQYEQKNTAACRHATGRRKKTAGTAFPRPATGHFNSFAPRQHSVLAGWHSALLMQMRLAETSEQIKKHGMNNEPIRQTSSMAKYKLEYIWLDGYEPVPNLRGKTHIKEFEQFPETGRTSHVGL